MKNEITVAFYTVKVTIPSGSTHQEIASAWLLSADLHQAIEDLIPENDVAVGIDITNEIVVCPHCRGQHEE